MTVTLDINMDEKCPECRKSGAVNGGICLKCFVKVLSDKPLKSPEARAARERAERIRASAVAARFGAGMLPNSAIKE